MRLDQGVEEHLLADESHYVQLLANLFRTFVDDASPFLRPRITVLHNAVKIAVIFQTSH